MARRARYAAFAFLGLLLASSSLFTGGVESVSPIVPVAQVQTAVPTQGSANEEISHVENARGEPPGVSVQPGISRKTAGKSLEDYADLLLLERELGARFVNEEVRLHGKMSKAASQSLKGLLTLLLCVALMEVVFRYYLEPVTPQVQQIYKQKYPGRAPLDKRTAPVVAILSSPLVALLCFLTLIFAAFGLFKLLVGFYRNTSARIDLEFRVRLKEDAMEALQKAEEQEALARFSNNLGQ